MTKFRLISCLSAAMAFAFLVAPASAQSLGTFAWQLAPYCNVVTVNVIQVGPVYTLDGWDDQCSGTNLRSPVVGAATLNFDGSIGLGLNIVTAPGGVPVHVEARVTLPSASGSWRDSAGNSGDFILGGNPSGRGPRPPGGIGANAINPAQVQTRVSGACPAGQLMISVRQDGGVNCQSAGSAGIGDVTGVAVGAGLTGTQLDGPVPSLAVDFAGPGAAITAARSDHTHARSGGANTAAGDEALISNTPSTTTEAGTQNTAFGSGALRSNTGGYTNTALGVQALYANTTGYWNAAAGPYALRFNTTGNSNTATGNAALRGNLTGNNNTADGARALENSLGSSNTAVGQKALYDNTTGSNNIAIGFEAGNVPGSTSPSFTGSGNIYIGAGVGPAVANEANTIRIGNTAEPTDTFIAGINGRTSSGGVGVFVNAAGKLGTPTSSARFKDDIMPLGESLRAKVQGLTPVSFTYKPEYDDGSKQIQYGLIAEQVAETFPELLVRDAEGRPQTVRYHLLTPLLLSEVQRLEREREAQRARLDEQASEIAALRELVLTLQRQITTVQVASEAAGRVARPE